MSATTAVLDRYELLEHIIAFLPPHDISKAQRVCKAWQELVIGSKKIRSAWALKPVPLPSYWMTPIYTCEIPIRMHQRIAEEKSESSSGGLTGKWVLSRMLELSETEGYASESHVLLTDPPVTKAHLLHYCHTRMVVSVAELRSPTGITMELALEAATAMLKSELRYGCCCAALPFQPTAQIRIMLKAMRTQTKGASDTSKEDAIRA